MDGLLASLWAELLKMRRSKVFVTTVALFMFIGLAMGLLMWAVRHPEIAGRSAMVSAKASVVGAADWPSFFGLLLQVILALGPLGFAMITSWTFAREYSDRTIKDLLALPVPRLTIVTSKFAVVALWGTALALALFAVALATGATVGMPGWSGADARDAFAKFMTGSTLTLLLCTPVAFVASLSRGYLLPVGFAILMLIMTNLLAIGVPGILPYFPWAIPALCTGVAGREALLQPGATSCLVLAATSVLGFAGTALWWRFADQT